MPKISEHTPVTEKHTKEEEPLKGTLIASLMLGGLIVVCWIAAFLFHLSQA